MIDLKSESIERGAAWKAEVRFETIKMVTDIEKHSAAANIIGWLVLAIAASLLPNREMFIVPLILRIGAMFLNRRGWNAIRKQMNERPDTLPNFHWLCFCLFIAGATWACAMLPMFLDSTMHPARVAVGGTVIMAVALIYSMLAPLRKVGLALAAGFFSVMAIGLTIITGTFSFGAILSTLGMGLALAAFSVATSRQKEATAATLVDNRHLELALAHSLEEAEYLATRDPLTGMLNRRAFFKAEQHPTLRNGVTQHLLTIDLDHFKQVNDRHGHDVGDRVLVATAEQIRISINEIPGSGHCGCRFGGEEFVIFVDGVDPMAMRRAAEALRRRIRNVPKILDMEGKMKVSASIGIAKLGRDECFDDALRRSDSAMYRAKDRGRDRIELAA